MIYVAYKNFKTILFDKNQVINRVNLNLYA